MSSRPCKLGFGAFENLSENSVFLFPLTNDEAGGGGAAGLMGNVVLTWRRKQRYRGGNNNLTVMVPMIHTDAFK